MTNPTLVERLRAEALALDAQIATCEHALHAAPIGCPYCKRDTRQRDLLNKAADALTGQEGATLIAVERQRQVLAEGWSPDHDDTHKHGELAFTAARYALHDVGAGVDPSDLAQAKIALAAAGRWDSCWWKPRDPIRNLVRAGALIAAEIDRRQRAQEGCEAQNPLAIAQQNPLATVREGAAPSPRAIEALRKVRAHTSYNPGASRELLAGLLSSIERIADAALGQPPEGTEPAAQPPSGEKL